MTVHRETLRNSFPGPRLAGLAMILAPLFLIVGATLAIPFETGDDATRQQALADDPVRGDVVLNGLFGGAILVSVCIVAMARLIATKKPLLAAIGGALALAGTYVSAMFGGVMMYEIALAAEPNREVALAVLARGEPPIVALLALPGMILGWLVLGFGAWRAGVFGPLRSIALAGPALLPFAVLATPALLPVPYTLLAIALVPLGVHLLARRTPARTGQRDKASA